MNLILQLKGAWVEPESEAKFHRQEKIARNLFVLTVVIVVSCLLTLLAFDVYYYKTSDALRPAGLRYAESISECFFFCVASVTLIVLWRDFTQLCGTYVSETEMTKLRRDMAMFIAAYTISSIISVVVEAFGLDNGFLRFSLDITVTLALDLCTIGVTLFLNHQKTQQLKKQK